MSGNTQVVGGPSCAVVLGPGGEAVNDDASLVLRPLAADGDITARVTALTGASAPPEGRVTACHCPVRDGRST